MSENLKRAESLFNRILNPDGAGETTFKLAVEEKKKKRGHNQQHHHNNHHYHHHHHHHHHNHTTTNNNNNNNTTTATASTNNNSHHHHNNNNHNNNGGNGYNGGSNGSLGHSNGYSNNHGNHNHHNTNDSHHSHRPKSRFKQDLIHHPALKIGDQIIVPSGHHVLPYNWTIWYHSRYKKGLDRSNYIATSNQVECPLIDADGKTKVISSLEQMWMSFACIKPSRELAIGTELFLFKAGITPAWEDAFNKRGGRWIFKFKRRYVDNNVCDKARLKTTIIWERLILRLTAGCLDNDNQDALLADISGIVLSIRKDEDYISIWNSNWKLPKSDRGPMKQNIRDMMMSIIKECDEILLGVPQMAVNVDGITSEYRIHFDPIKSKRKDDIQH